MPLIERYIFKSQNEDERKSEELKESKEVHSSPAPNHPQIPLMVLANRRTIPLFLGSIPIGTLPRILNRQRARERGRMREKPLLPSRCHICRIDRGRMVSSFSQKFFGQFSSGYPKKKQCSRKATGRKPGLNPPLTGASSNFSVLFSRARISENSHSKGHESN